MKLRTSFFNPTAFKKDATRFAPVWALYTLFLLLMMTAVLSEKGDYWRASNLAPLLGPTAVLAMGYALLNAQLLFGDLYNARLCNALHAMPLRRECWFLTHVTSGLAFALIPNLVVSLITMPMLGAGWSVALWWLLAASLQYLFFFGLAVCSALCVGNRFAMVLVYALANFLSLLVYWFAYSLFEPLLTGVRIPSEPFLNWCPVYDMTSSNDLVDILAFIASNMDQPAIQQIIVGEGWGYLAVCAVLGVVLLGIALLLYLGRKLECAGDFMAIPVLEPVFLVLFSLTVGAFFQIFSDLFGSWGKGGDYCFLALGLAVGFFTGRMLLKRSLRVFQPKAFAGLAVLAAVVALSLALTALDALGISRRIPQLTEIKSVTIQSSYGEPDALVLNTDADIQKILDVHRDAISGAAQQVPQSQYLLSSEPYYHYVEIELTYTLTNGSTMSRYYSIATDSRAGQVMKEFFTRVECVLGVPEDYLSDLARTISYMQINGTDAYVEGYADTVSLLNALAADCKAGNLAQNWGYHTNDEYVANIWFEYGVSEERFRSVNISVFSSCQNTIQWMEERGIAFEPGYLD